MIERIEPGDILGFIRRLPEQSKFDCKSTLSLSNDSEKSELIKDVVAIANAHGQATGYLFYGVDLSASQPVVGVQQRFDDANLQQIVAPKLETAPAFLYYDIEVGDKIVAVIAIPPSRHRPHVLRTSFGLLRAGVIPIRKGSSTTWANSADLQQMFENRTGGRNERSELENILRLAADPSTSTDALAIRLWGYATRDENTEVDWLKHEITGFNEGDVDDLPDYRMAKCWVTSQELSPLELLTGPLETLVALNRERFQEHTFFLGHSISQIEAMLDSATNARGVLYRQKKLPTVEGDIADAWIYFSRDSLLWILTRIRNRLTELAMGLQMPRVPR